MSAARHPASKAGSWPWLFCSRFTGRHWRRSPGASALLGAIVALGVGVFFAIRLANQAAVAGFQDFTGVLAAETDVLIQARSGFLPEGVLGELRTALGDAPVRLLPILESTAARPRAAGDESIGSRATFTLLGVDWIAMQNFVTPSEAGRGAGVSQLDPDAAARVPNAVFDSELWSAFRDPHAVFISPALARRDLLAVGSELSLVVQDRPVPLRVVGILPEHEARPRVPAHLVVMDLPAVQRLTQNPGRLSRIEFLVEEGPGRSERVAALRETLRAQAPDAAGAPRWVVSSPAERRAGAAIMTRAFRLNLTILSLLSLVVGVYLIFQALDGAVIRRRDEIAILRSLGVTAGEIRNGWLAESCALGLFGGVLGLALGWLGAQGAVRLVSRTVNALYHSSAAEAAALDPAEALLALAASVATCLLAGWLPARTAAAIPPAQLLARSQGAPGERRGLWRHPLAAPAWVAAGIALCGLPPLRLEGGGRFPAAAYLAAMAWVVGAGILGGRLLGDAARRLWFLGRSSVAWRLALSHLKHPSSRHRLASAALVCAVAMTAGMAILVRSFDGTMRGWIARTFQADLFVSSDGAQSASTENRMTPETWRAVAGHPSVDRAQVVQAARMQLPEAETMLVGCDLGFFRDHARPAWVSAPASDAVFDPVGNRDQVLVSEAFADRFQRRAGDVLELPTPAGLKVAAIAGIYADYGNERGSVLVDRGAFVDWFGDELASSVVLVLRRGADADQVRAELLAAHPGLAVFTQAHLRSEALRIFRQTFSITYALELIGVAVAVAGLGFTLMSLLWERREELATLRVLGCHRREIACAAAVEGLLIAASGVIVGLAVSLALGWLLIHRVNRQTFGWTLETHWPWGFLAALACLVLGTAWLTAWGTGLRAAQIPAEREE